MASINAIRTAVATISSLLLVLTTSRAQQDDADTADTPRPQLTITVEEPGHLRSTGEMTPDGWARAFDGVVIGNRTIIEYVTPLPCIFFDSASGEISARYVVYQTADEARTFDEGNIPGGALEQHYQILNILGSRLRRNPSARIGISGYDSNEPLLGESEAISVRRRNAVSDYLRNIWRIPERQILLLKSGGYPKWPSNKRDPLGKVENRRVECAVLDSLDKPTLRGDDFWSIRRPLVDTVVRTIAFPMTVGFRFKNTNWNQRTPSLWRCDVEITWNGEPWNHLSDVGADGAEYDWRNAKGDLPVGDGRFEARLIEYDSNGGERRSNELWIGVRYLSSDSTVQMAADSKPIYRFLIVRIYPDDTEHFSSPYNARIIHQYILPIIDRKTRVDVRGRTDAVGLEDRNLMLSKMNSDEVGHAIRAWSKPGPASMIVAPLGESYPLFDNSLAEGRTYNRSVELIFETPPP